MYICSGCKNMVSQKMCGFYWVTLYLEQTVWTSRDSVNHCFHLPSVLSENRIKSLTLNVPPAGAVLPHTTQTPDRVRFNSLVLLCFVHLVCMLYVYQYQNFWWIKMHIIDYWSSPYSRSTSVNCHITPVNTEARRYTRCDHRCKRCCDQLQRQSHRLRLTVIWSD